jgi:hypothetical protein
MDVGITGERLVWRGQQVTQVLRDPVCLGGGEILEVVLATEDGDCREVAVLILDREVGDESRRLAGVLDIASLQGRAYGVRRTVESVAADHRVDRLIVPILSGGGNGAQPGRCEQGRRRSGSSAAQRAAPRKAASQ